MPFTFGGIWPISFMRKKFLKRQVNDMKINRPEIINMINKIYKQEQLHGKSKPNEAARVSSGDQLEISSNIETLKKEMARLEGADPARLQKIAELSRQIETGEYKVDSQELAQIILKAAKDQR